MIKLHALKRRNPETGKLNPTMLYKKKFMKNPIYNLIRVGE